MHIVPRQAGTGQRLCACMLKGVSSTHVHTSSSLPPALVLMPCAAEHQGARGAAAQPAEQVRGGRRAAHTERGCQAVSAESASAKAREKAQSGCAMVPFWGSIAAGRAHGCPSRCCRSSRAGSLLASWPGTGALLKNVVCACSSFSCRARECVTVSMRGACKTQYQL